MDSILLTVDVEDWFQVENFKPWIPFSSWPSRELRVEKNTHRLLDLFDSVELQHPSIPASQHQAQCSPKATFFILGWIAERLPNLVREIQARGHEVASHGYNHNLCNQESHKDLKKDLIGSKKLLEDITGGPVFGYRAPNFSVNDNILTLIKDCGYLYDSSFNSFAVNGRYGQIALSGDGKKGIAFQVAGRFFELPISNLRLGNHILPWGGGGYFRLLPFPLFRLGVHSILKKEKAYLYYIHPWEIDPEQPRVSGASQFYKFRHYVNLKKSHSKLHSLSRNFKHCRFITCHQYLQETVKDNNIRH